MHTEVADFVAHLLHSSTVTHQMHWSTDSYAKHKALKKYYTGIVGLADAYAEAWMGKYEEQLTQFPAEFHNAKEPIAYLKGVKQFVVDAREHLPNDSELQNIIDEIAKLINDTVYKLKFLS